MDFPEGGKAFSRLTTWIAIDWVTNRSSLVFFIKRRLNVQSAHGKARTSEVLRRVEPCSSDRYSVKSRAGKLEALQDMG